MDLTVGGRGWLVRRARIESLAAAIEACSRELDEGASLARARANMTSAWDTANSPFSGLVDLVDHLAPGGNYDC